LLVFVTASKGSPLSVCVADIFNMNLIENNQQDATVY
jgi:hypothetical protein